MTQILPTAVSLHGSVSIPADKSISHRSAMLSALADGTSRIRNFPRSADPLSTLRVLRGLGVSIHRDNDDVLVVEGVGIDGLRPPDAPLDCGNSGTTMRLMSGILAGQPFGSVLTGDESLQMRPMKRIADPLRAMGGRVTLVDGHAPIRLRPAPEGGLKGTKYRLPVASAQVKSCVLLAGLYARGRTTVIEPTRCRDHTERMLGLETHEVGGEREIYVDGGHRIEPGTWTVPGDFSGAAFFIVAATITPGSEILIENVGLNPSRTALIDVLREMGADIRIENERAEGSEPIGDILVSSAPLHGVEVGGRVIPNLIDEVPVLAVAAACAEGQTVIRDAEELRVKETDRLHAITENLRAMGAEIDERPDGLDIEGNGPNLLGTTVRSFDDHRIAMAMGVAACVAHGPTQVVDAKCARVSFPGFWDELDRLAKPR
ncbi:3-phosphoshikimate 1-carboxyvinyltransferase [Longibacter salinarum]|uniref:3-phosphoshikimate 1-carboxyvinyltransferase n=1 Tax=Longibacter salinarum TaxID=1850348 RepID=A0A2A8CXM1_9BACT|nr:3-phosphoshikimate 1-carboxyvinyltransferase [Longibacter salinarum]PEN13370.1 3-phosphoshikimate 1-carboxyvinyltransferase [Longibacter salinarum]